MLNQIDGWLGLIIKSDLSKIIYNEIKDVAPNDGLKPSLDEGFESTDGNMSVDIDANEYVYTRGDALFEIIGINDERSLSGTSSYNLEFPINVGPYNWASVEFVIDLVNIILFLGGKF